MNLFLGLLPLSFHTQFRYWLILYLNTLGVQFKITVQICDIKLFTNNNNLCVSCFVSGKCTVLWVFILILWPSSCKYSTCLAALGKNSQVHTRGPVLSHVFFLRAACEEVERRARERERDTHRAAARYALASRGSNKLPTSTFIIFHFLRAGDVLLLGKRRKYTNSRGEQRNCLIRRIRASGPHKNQPSGHFRSWPLPKLADLRQWTPIGWEFLICFAQVNL